MKKDIHADYYQTKVICSCGNTFTIGSTVKDDIKVEVCYKCHPFYTGKQKLVDTAGQVEAFERRRKKAQELAAKNDKGKKDETLADEQKEENVENEDKKKKTEKQDTPQEENVSTDDGQKDSKLDAVDTAEEKTSEGESTEKGEPEEAEDHVKEGEEKEDKK